MSIFVRRLPLVLGALLALGCKDPKPTTGTLVVDIDGLPAGAIADVRVTGPADFNEAVSESRTFERLAPGDYVVTISSVTHQNGLFTSTVEQEIHSVMAGATETSTVTYGLTGGSIDLTISGLPTGASPAVRLEGANNFSRIVLTSGIQAGLPAGTYTIRADSFPGADGHRYGANAYVQTVTVPASLTPVPASVAYGIVSGTLSVEVTGLASPPSPAPVHITGPGNFSRTTSVTAEYRGLAAGTYSITAAETGACPSRYVAAQPSQSVSVASGAQVSRTVSYEPLSTSAANYNLTINGAHAIQVTQDYNGTVPMVAGKRALLRVFGVANQCEPSTLPKVRVTLSDGTVFDGLELGAGETGVRLSPEQGFLSASWNVELPASVVAGPSLGFFAEIDPGNEVAEANESDNRYPAVGYKDIPVKTVAPLGLRFVPITIAATGLTGSISAGNADEFLDKPRRMLPIHSFDVDFASTFTTFQPPLSASGDSWSAVLSELNSKVRAETPSNRFHYGVVKVTYQSGVAGVGYVGSPSSVLSRAALGWDYLPSGSGIMAHELGHNFGRFHSPCGNPGGIDQNWRSDGFYAGGFIGVYGFDFTDNSVKDPQLFTDVMGYCNNQWISDYTYAGMLNSLTDPNRVASQPMVSGAQEQAAILVWGRIVNGVPVLEPAFEVTARPHMPAPGPHRLSLMGADGRELVGVSFAADRIADLPDAETFAFTIPRSMLRGRDIASLRLVARGGRTVTNVASADVAADAGMTMTRLNPRAMRLRWNAQRFPVVMVRDPDTREILSFARGGDVTVVTSKTELEMNYSNRVRSLRELRRPR